MAVTLYGIPNCDTVKKARTWLDQNGIAYTFHDFKKAGLTPVLVNRKGTTWRALPDERKASTADAKSAAALMLEAPSVIKRPVLDCNGMTHVGFSDANYQQIFKK